uniref:Putative ovule protein n=1 Tax=Solanum chacoense TaxID=4108 RepID=A0A0V0H7F3_SOLCH
MKDQMAEYFSTRKFNAHGRFMSLLSLKGADRAVVILPEASNAGWKDIALINYSPPRTLKAPHRMVDINHSDAKVVEDSKWQSYTTEVPESKRQEVSTSATIEYGRGLIGRCITGNFGNLGSEMPTLSEVRKWAPSTWKKVFGVISTR